MREAPNFDFEQIGPEKLEEMLVNATTTMEITIPDITIITQGMTLYRDAVIARAGKLMDETKDKTDPIFLQSMCSVDRLVTSLQILWAKVEIAKNEVQKKADDIIGIPLTELRTLKKCTETEQAAINILDAVGAKESKEEKKVQPQKTENSLYKRLRNAQLPNS